MARALKTWKLPLKIFREGVICKNSLGGDVHSHERLLGLYAYLQCSMLGHLTIIHLPPADIVAEVRRQRNIYFTFVPKMGSSTVFMNP